MEAYIVKEQDLADIIKKNEENILIFNPNYILSKQQALFAAKMAMMAMEKNQNIANKLPIEFLVRLSGQKQIAKALEFGPKGIEDVVGIIVLDSTLRDNIQEISFMANEQKVMRAYDISPHEDLQRAVYEKMALVDL